MSVRFIIVFIDKFNPSSATLGKLESTPYEGYLNYVESSKEEIFQKH